MRRPSVLFINRVYPPVRGATGRVLQDLARAMAREGWHVTVITTGPKAENERDGAIRIIRLKGPEKPSNMLVYGWIWLRMLICALRLPRRHLVITLTDPPFLVMLGSMVAKFKKCHHINWCHDLYPDVLPALGYRIPGFLMSFLLTLSRRAMRSCDKIVVIGRCMARNLTYTGLDPRRITVIPNWPDFELMRPAGKNRFNNTSLHLMAVNGMRPYDELLKEGPKFRVLYAGNIGRAHPIDTILDAAEILNSETPDIEFVFVGEGARFDMVVRERARRRLDNVRLLPYQPPKRLRELMESGDVHLVSMKETAAGAMVPSKLYAALAAERPCILIGPEHSETAKIIHDFKAGSVVPQGQATQLAEIIRAYRMNGDVWFAAHKGAAKAGNVFVPDEAINAWIERAWSVIHDEIEAGSA